MKTMPSSQRPETVRKEILLKRKADAERKVRTHRLIERGAILESVFPEIIPMTGEQVKAFLEKMR